MTAPELGHIALEHVCPLVPTNTDMIIDTKLESQATHFAKELSTRRSDQNSSPEFHLAHYFPSDVIDQKIQSLNMVYDENEL